VIRASRITLAQARWPRAGGDGRAQVPRKGETNYPAVARSAQQVLGRSRQALGRAVAAQLPPARRQEREQVMTKVILAALALAIFGVTLAGCHAEGTVKDPNSSSSVQLPR
jgi:hypothetical protein